MKIYNKINNYLHSICPIITFNTKEPIFIIFCTNSLFALLCAVIIKQEILSSHDVFGGCFHVTLLTVTWFYYMYKTTIIKKPIKNPKKIEVPQIKNNTKERLNFTKVNSSSSLREFFFNAHK